MSRPNIFIFVYVAVGVVAVAGLMAFITLIHRHCKKLSRKNSLERVQCSEEMEIPSEMLGPLNVHQHSNGNTVVILPFWVDHDTNNATFIQSFIIDSTGAESVTAQFDHSTEDTELDVPLPAYSAQERPPAYDLSGQHEESHPSELTTVSTPVPPSYQANNVR